MVGRLVTRVLPRPWAKIDMRFRFKFGSDPPSDLTIIAGRNNTGKRT